LLLGLLEVLVGLMHQMFHLYLNYQKLLVLPEALLLLGLPEVL
jgi:hypothetical protein